MDLPLHSIDLPRPALLLPVAALAVTAGAGVAVWAVLRKRPSAEELEQRRRHILASTGRIVDGTLIGVDPAEDDPSRVFYTYRVAGVAYECSQDISALTAQVRRVRLDFPVQVRYSNKNPGNSIVIDESWNGLWTASRDE
jgi:hypothetical protein